MKILMGCEDRVNLQEIVG